MGGKQDLSHRSLLHSRSEIQPNKLSVYFFNAPSLGHCLAFSLWTHYPNLSNEAVFFINSLKYNRSVSLPHKSCYLCSFHLQQAYYILAINCKRQYLLLFHARIMSITFPYIFRAMGVVMTLKVVR